MNSPHRVSDSYLFDDQSYGQLDSKLELITELRDAEYITATCDYEEGYLFLRGLNSAAMALFIDQVEELTVHNIHVKSYSELQDVLAFIREYVGEPDTDGSNWSRLRMSTL